MLPNYLLLINAFATTVLAVSNFTYYSAGCSGNNSFTVDSTGHVNRTITVGAYNRTYLLHVPSEYYQVAGNSSGKGSLPLVIGFHGASGTSTNQEKLSQFSLPGVRIGRMPIIAAYPQGVNSGTRDGVWAGAPYSNSSVDDFQFVLDMLKDIQSHYCINPTRVYATGKSNGGGFTNLLACTAKFTNIFAAFAMASPALYNETLVFSGCEPSRPVPIITSHGVVDQTIPFIGRNDTDGAYGVGVATINVPLWRQQWAERNGCTGLSLNATTSTPYANTTEYVWDCEAEVRAFTVSNLGHAWPTTQGLDASGGINATASFNLTSPQILDFFTRNTLPLWLLS